MLKKFEWFLKVSRAGVNPQLNSDLARRIIFSNILFISLPIVYSIFMVIDYQTYWLPSNYLKFDQYIVPIVILICLICFWLNKKEKTNLSRNLFLITWPLLLHVIPIQLQSSPSDYYFAFPVGMIFHSIMIQLMFSYSRQPVQFFGWMIINFLTLLLVPHILAHFDLFHKIPVAMLSSRYYSLDFILYWLLFNLVVFYTIVELEKYINKVHHSRAMIEVQKDELAQLNQNLETVVRLRTTALEEQNQKLKDYAFYNAHTLRGPFCRVKGLVHLRQLVNVEGGDEEEINARLLQSMDELDEKIQEIQWIVQHDDLIKFRDLSER